MGRFVTTTTRGHLIYLYNSTADLKEGKFDDTEENPWRYADNDEVYNNDGQHERPCKRCGKMPTEEGHDACLGNIPGVVAACCGHGIEDPYVLTEGGIVSEIPGMYTKKFSSQWYENHTPTISDDIRLFKEPGYFLTPHNGCLPIASKIIDGKHHLIWTPIEYMGFSCYKRLTPRDVEFANSDLSAAINAFNTLFGNDVTLELPDLRLGHSIVQTLREYNKLTNEDKELDVMSFFVSDTFCGYPMRIGAYRDQTMFYSSVPMEMNTIRLVFTLPLDCKPPAIFDDLKPVDFTENYTEQWFLDAHESDN